MHKWKPSRKTVLIILLVIFLLWLIPLPFKPSPYSYIYSYSAKQSLSNSSDPVYLPGAEFIANSGFTAYQGWVDTYEITYSNAKIKGLDGFVILYQLSDSSVIKDGTEGPKAAQFTNFVRAAKDKSCDIPEELPGFRICTYENSSYLIRDVQNRGKTITLIQPIYDKPNRQDLSPAGFDVRFMNSLQPIPVDKAVKEYFKPRF